MATEILGLAEQARRSVAENSGSPRRLSVLATPLVAEHIGPLIELFTARDEDVEIAVSTAPAASFAEALEHRRADIALGPSPGAADDDRRRPVPALPPDPRRRPVASFGGLAGDRARVVVRRALARRPAGARPLRGAPGLFFARHGLDPASVATYSSGAAAIAAAAAGEGIVLTLAHAVVDEVRRRALVRLDVRGTPIVEMWHASTLGLGRALPAALGSAALRHHLRGDPGDLDRPRRRRLDPDAPEGPRHASGSPYAARGG